VITYAVEQWPDVWREASALWQEHWEEIALNRDAIPLDPDIDALNAFHASGALHIVIARCDGAIIGYHASIVRPHIHYRRSLSAFTDLYFIRKEHRRGMVGVNLFREVERSLRARGVQKMFTGTKLSLDMGRIFERLGWTETERLYTKFIGD
jgi:GNAT superfamily N-acetyltransferase